MEQPGLSPEARKSLSERIREIRREVPCDGRLWHDDPEDELYHLHGSPEALAKLLLDLAQNVGVQMPADEVGGFFDSRGEVPAARDSNDC